jgi:hypothetical protein
MLTDHRAVWFTAGEATLDRAAVNPRRRGRLPLVASWTWNLGGASHARRHIWDTFTLTYVVLGAAPSRWVQTATPPRRQEPVIGLESAGGGAYPVIGGADLETPTHIVIVSTSPYRLAALLGRSPVGLGHFKP